MEPMKLAVGLFDRADSVRRQSGYTGLLAYYALAQVAVEQNDDALLRRCQDHLKRYPDGFDHPNYNFEVYRGGGNAKAYLLLQEKLGRIALDPEFSSKHRGVVRDFAEETLSAPAGENGILCMPRRHAQIWIDVVTAVTPYMLYAGLLLGEERYIDFAAEQCLKMYRLFLDKDCGLLHQSKGFRKDPAALSDDHWSRGNGWCFVGLADLLQYLPHDSKWRPEIADAFGSLCEATLGYQDENGFWHQEMTRPDCWPESSGTGLILYAFGAGLRLGLLGEAFRTAFARGVQGLARLAVGADFETYLSCPGCLCPGTGDRKGTIEAYMQDKQPQIDEPHSFGALMLAFLEAHRNGIADLAVGRDDA